MAAEHGEEEVRWSGWTSIAGEYGVLLTEMGSMEELNNPIKSYPRIKVCNKELRMHSTEHVICRFFSFLEQQTLLIHFFIGL